MSELDRIMGLIDRHAVARAQLEASYERHTQMSVRRFRDEKERSLRDEIKREIARLLESDETPVALCGDCDDPVHDGGCPPESQ